MTRRGLALAGLVAIAAATVVVVVRRPSGSSRAVHGPPDASHLPRPPTPLHPSTRAGIELGRSLFFDPRLSQNDTIACATCHEPARAFTDGVARSTRGASGKVLPRNAPGLANIAWATSLFWDGGSKNLESLAFGPLTHPDEMAESVEHMINQLAADPRMRAAFAAAFPGKGVTPSTVMQALAQYMRSLVSVESRYDRWVRGEPDAELADAEHRGLAIYRARCARCHATDLFTDHGFHDIGLDPAEPLAAEDPRRGRARVTFAAADERAYRTPTLRNLSFTAPYMHDGRFATLGAVFEHYRRGVHRTPSLDPALLGPDGALGIALSTDEERDVTAFLATLDDDRFLARHRR